MKDSKTRQEFNDYIKSIGGLENGYFPNRPPLFKVGSVGDGWLPLLKELIEDLIKLGWNKQICDIKEKFGGLRFYIQGGTDEIYERIDKAENDSYKICEVCGEPGEIVNGSWIKTLCDKHKQEREN